MSRRSRDEASTGAERDRFAEGVEAQRAALRTLEVRAQRARAQYARLLDADGELSGDVNLGIGHFELVLDNGLGAHVTRAGDPLEFVADPVALRAGLATPLLQLLVALALCSGPGPAFFLSVMSSSPMATPSGVGR